MSSRYFENTSCEYYPCHGIEHMNCLFCYCPLYPLSDCGGAPSYLDTEKGKIKDCSSCCFPHIAENYDKIIEKLRLAAMY